VNPPSYFLRFPDRPEARIIALPASLGGPFEVAGLKWISSFPRNIEHGLPRASAVLVLNDLATGYPLACLESSIISATRTAASAVLAAGALHATRARPRRITFFGAGLIARYVGEYFRRTGWTFDVVGVFDRSPDYAAQFAATVRGKPVASPVVIHADAETAVRSSDLIVFATTAGTPHVHDVAWFSHAPTVLHVSLRDLAPEIILDSVNVLDDVDHCLRAETSPHLAEQRTGSRDFVAGVLADVLTGDLVPPPDRTTIFSPFGLGILDLAVGQFVYEAARRKGTLHELPGFFHELSRY
jgi:ornithine cyclodeaminase